MPQYGERHMTYPAYCVILYSKDKKYKIYIITWKHHMNITKK